MADTAAPPSYEQATQSRHLSTNSEAQIQQTGSWLCPRKWLSCFYRTEHSESQPRPAPLYPQLKPSEIDNPGLVLCAMCDKFHERPQAADSFDIGGPACVADGLSIPLGGGRHLSWWQAHMYMRSHRLTPEHGTATLLPYRSWKDLGWQYAVRYRVIDHRLVLRICTFKKIDLTDPFNGLTDAPSCIHGDPMGILQMSLQETILRLLSGPEKRVCESQLWRCEACPSQWRIGAITNARGFISEVPTGKNATYKVVIVRYIDVGRCESPKERHWAALSSAEFRGVRDAGKEAPEAFAMDTDRCLEAWAIWDAD